MALLSDFGQASLQLGGGRRHLLLSCQRRPEHLHRALPHRSVRPVSDSTTAIHIATQENRNKKYVLAKQYVCIQYSCISYKLET